MMDVKQNNSLLCSCVSLRQRTKTLYLIQTNKPSEVHFLYKTLESKNILFRHPGSMLKSQFCTSYFLLAQVNMLPELCNSIQWSIMLKAEATDLGKDKNKMKNHCQAAKDQHSTPPLPQLILCISAGRKLHKKQRKKSRHKP